MIKTTGELLKNIATIEDLKIYAVNEMTKADIDLPLSEFRYLMRDILEYDMSSLITENKSILSDVQKVKFLQALTRRLKREPFAYITGKADFFGREFDVGTGVLIPRADTEILIEKVLEKSDLLPAEVFLLDTFTGSGCIGITLALELIAKGFNVKLNLADISPETMEFAVRNINRYGLAERTETFITDIWPARPDAKKYDLISANPPYIEADVIPRLQAEVYLYEPVLALDGGKDGLNLYRRLFAEAGKFLAPEGFMICEHGYDQANDIRTLADENGWDKIEMHNDYGGNPRAVICSRI